MYTNDIWIKVIAMVVVGIIIIAGTLFNIYKSKKSNKESSAAIGIAIVLIIYAGVCGVKAMNPHYETITASYVYQTGNGEIFGRQYNFKDSSGNVYTLSMDPITYRKIFRGKEFKEEESYIITYETKSETIVGIEE